MGSHFAMQTCCCKIVAGAFVWPALQSHQWLSVFAARRSKMSFARWMVSSVRV